MKTTFLTLIMLSLSIYIFAQEATPLKKWSFGAELFTNSTHEIITNDGTVDSELEQFWNEIEVAKFCLSGQIYASYNFNSKSSLSIGIGYQNIGSQTKVKQLVYGNYIDSRRGFIIDSSSQGPPTYHKFVYNHHNLQVPIFYKYNFSSRFFARSGVSTIFNISNSTTSVKRTENNVTRNRDYYKSANTRSINFSGNLGIGYSYFKSSKLDLYVQANAETTFLQLHKNAPLNRRPVSIGFIFGARI